MWGGTGLAGSRAAENEGSLTSIWISIDDSVSGFVLGTIVSRYPKLLFHSYPERAITTYTYVGGGVRSGIGFSTVVPVIPLLPSSVSVGYDTVMATGSHSAGGVRS